MLFHFCFLLGSYEVASGIQMKCKLSRVRLDFENDLILLLKLFWSDYVPRKIWLDFIYHLYAKNIYVVKS